MTKQGYDAVFFDVDGTLIDSAPGIRKTFAYTFKTLGVDDTDIDYNQFFGPPLRKSYAKYFDTDAAVEKAVLLYRSYYNEEGQHLCRVYPGVKEMLSALRAAGIILCTATSKPIPVVEPILKEQGIYEFFHFVGGASLDSSIDTKTAVIQNLLQKDILQNKKILMVGDRKDDMEGAANSGLPAAAVLYGYGSYEELSPYTPCIMADNCEQLTNYILNGSK